MLNDLLEIALAMPCTSHWTGGGGDELVNRSYRDRAADDLGHRDVTRIVIVLYSKIAIYCRKEHFHPKKSRTSRDRPDGTTHTGASLETHNYYLLLLLFGLIHISLTFSERDVGTALSYRDKNHFGASVSRKTNFKSSIWKWQRRHFRKLLEVARFSLRDVTLAKIVRPSKLPSSPPPPGCDPLTAVKTSYPLTSITWLYRGLRCRLIEDKCFFEVIRWQGTGFQMIAGSGLIF